MRSRNPLLTAFVLSMTLTVPVAMAMESASAGVFDQAKKGPKKPNQNNNQGRGNGHGGGGEDLTHIRFAGLDTNHDGQISRSEWRGNDQSFSQHDWNGDGVLSGIEVMPGAQRPVDFNTLDRNDDNRISLSEWPGNRFFFNLLDTNDDNFLSQAELGANGGVFARGRLEDIFRVLDANGDSRLSPTEWPDAASFDRLDANNDNLLTLDEFRRLSAILGGDDDDDDDGEDNLQNLFNRLDANDDNRISSAEWPAQLGATLFDRLDTNNDNFLSWDEFRQGRALLTNDDDDDEEDDLRATFQSWDTNHDNRLSKSEWHGNIKNFNRLDTNGDGFLTWEEFSRRAGGHH